MLRKIGIIAVLSLIVAALAAVPALAANPGTSTSGGQAPDQRGPRNDGEPATVNCKIAGLGNGIDVSR